MGALLVTAGLAFDTVAVAGDRWAWDGSSATGARDRSDRSTTTTVALAESPEEFLAALATAFRSGDVSFLLSRLHPAVLARYGEAQCRQALPAYTDPSAMFAVQQVGPDEAFTWTTEPDTQHPRSSGVSDARSVEVIRAARGVATPAQIHIARVGAHYTWFIDCGEPISG